MEHHVSLTTLIKATLAAIALAAVALVLFILPAEYNIDPTGVGQKLGLSVLAESAQAASLPAVPAAGPNDPDRASQPARLDDRKASPPAEVDASSHERRRYRCQQPAGDGRAGH